MPASKRPDPMLEILATRGQPAESCKLCLWLATAPRERAEAIRQAVADPEMPINTIVRALEAGDVMNIRSHALRRHREENHG